MQDFTNSVMKVRYRWFATFVHTSDNFWVAFRKVGLACVWDAVWEAAGCDAID
jgi:hypothetical protein